MAKLGYIRVSSKDQNLARQEAMMQAFEVERIFTDKQSGKDANRPGLQELLSYARQGDTVYFESISRLARNTRDFLSIMETFEKRGVAAVSSKEPIDTTTPAGKLIYTIFAALAELEREYIKQRQAEGLAEARKRGEQFGRPRLPIPDDFDKVVAEWRAGKTTAADAWRKLHMTKSAFYRALKKEGSA